MVNCCHVALTLCGVIFGMLAMFFNYNLKLGARTAQLEKKNGSEEAQLLIQQKQINELREEIKKLKAQNSA